MAAKIFMLKLISGIKLLAGFTVNVFKFLLLVLFGLVALIIFSLVAIFDKAYYRRGFDRVV
jgi:hypothetical protein